MKVTKTFAGCLLTALPLLIGCMPDSDSQVGEWNEQDAQLAKMALQALGAEVEGTQERRCQSCHSVSRAKVQDWLELTQNSESSCLPFTSRRYVYKPRGGNEASTEAELNPTCETQAQVEDGKCYLDPSSELMSTEQALEIVNCMRTDPANPSSTFNPGNLGIHSIQAHERNSHFQRLFEKAFPDAEESKRQRTEFVKRAKMPRGALFMDTIPDDADPNYTVAIKKEDYWVIREWFDRGVPALNQVLEEEPGPTECEPRITDELKAYVKENARQGWTMKNAIDGVQMYGCSTETVGGWPDTALACLTTAPQKTDWQATYSGAAAGSVVRDLKKLDYRTSYWTRSSADGRFVANGRSDEGGSAITDLELNRDIPIEASYDPGFYADNSTFVFQGTPVGAGFCPQDMLLNPPMQNGELVPITFQENGCSGTSSIDLYQHLGTSLDGAVAFAANGDYTSDDGVNERATENPSATAGPGAEVTISPIVKNGIGYDFLDQVKRETPFEGDTAISPTSRLISARLAGPDGKMLGVTMRLIKLTGSASDGYSVSLSEPSTYCGIDGGKTAVSYDDRFMAIHTYSEEGGRGKADVVLIDLSDGKTYQVTDMPAGTYAVFPHFRSDGWLYFLVSSDDQQNVGASDIALRIEKANPINDVTW